MCHWIESVVAIKALPPSGVKRRGEVALKPPPSCAFTNLLIPLRTTGTVARVRFTVLRGKSLASPLLEDRLDRIGRHHVDFTFVPSPVVKPIHAGIHSSPPFHLMTGIYGIGPCGFRVTDQPVDPPTGFVKGLVQACTKQEYCQAPSRRRYGIKTIYHYSESKDYHRMLPADVQKIRKVAYMLEFPEQSIFTVQSNDRRRPQQQRIYQIVLARATLAPVQRRLNILLSKEVYRDMHEADKHLPRHKLLIRRH